MGQLEERVRPFLTAMMLGHPITLLADAQRSLAEWVALKLMVAEQDHPPNAAVDEQARRAFGKSRRLPEGLNIWLLNCSGQEWQSAYYRHAATLSRLPAPDIDRRRKNTMSVALGIGRLLVFALYDPMALVGLELNQTRSRRIHPSSGERLHWPPERRVDGNEALWVALTLQRFLADEGIKRIDL